ncbi:MAG: tetratricopeptide repeat protein [Desulfobacterales bacterium]|nr:tetratricopeptide repeat protein [Desulfobacterales bacterium]
MSYLQLDEPEEAVKAYQTALEIDRYRDDLRVKLGNLYFSQGKYEDARTQYAEAVRLNPSTVNRYSLGQAYIELGRYARCRGPVRRNPAHQPRAGRRLPGHGADLQPQRETRGRPAAVRRRRSARDPGLYDAYAQKGYTYADMGDMENAQKMVDYLGTRSTRPTLADTLSRYMYKVDPPENAVRRCPSSSFHFSMGKGTPLVALNSYLANPGASETLTIDDPVRQEHGPGFDRERRQLADQPRDRRGAGASLQLRPARIPPTEVRLAAIPSAVAWDEDNLTATVYFKIRQNVERPTGRSTRPTSSSASPARTSTA